MFGLRHRALVALAAAAMLGACNEATTQAGSLDPQAERGRAFIIAEGCGDCHVIPGVTGATGLVGPPLNKIAKRTIIAGVLPNTPDNMVRWIEAPQSVVPGNAMPNMEIDDHDARDVAAYLYTLR